MNTEKNNEEKISRSVENKQPNRRAFLGHLTKAGIVAATIGAIGVKPFLGGIDSVVQASFAGYNSDGRATKSFRYRRRTARAERIDVGVQADNGDKARYSDFSGLHSKALLHNSLGVPNSTAMLSLIHAFETGDAADFANILVGTPGGGGNSKLNGPQVALAFDLEGLDSHATVIPAAPTTRSAQTAAEQVEHYWASLLADVPFTDYATNTQVGQAVTDMNNLSYLQSPANNQFPYPVTRQNLFRGRVATNDGNVKGPYISQFMVQPTFYGRQPLSQQYQTFLPVGGGGSNYMTTPGEYQLVQNGGDSGRTLAFDPTLRYLRNGRDLAAYTSADVLYQGYFTAFMVLAGLGAAPNPGSPYIGSLTQKAFATLGGPDCAGTLAEMATRALKAAWFHKWIKDLRMRPEEYGALVHARKTNASPMPQAAAELHPNVLNSVGLAQTFAANGSYLLPQAFPEGSPTHPCYPTGHGAVGGACATVLKFFFNGSQKIRPLLQAAGQDVVQPSTNGLALNAYTGSDRNTLDINGELNKLCFNISFGHGIHAGIHFRSSTYWSILLGEQVALSILQDRAKSYNEPFSIDITKFDGTIANITNIGGNDDDDDN
ncbi:vanadium-dependent haloperoxidase [soil metagenome]